MPLCVVPFGAKIAIGASPRSVLLRDSFGAVGLGACQEEFVTILAEVEFIPRAMTSTALESSNKPREER